MVVVLLSAVYLGVPVARPVIIVFASLASAGAIELGVRRRRPSRVIGWHCLGLALLLLGIAHALFLLLDAGTAEPMAYPAAPDVLLVAGYLLLAAALFLLVRPPAPARDETSLIDAISLTLAGSLVLWVTVVRPVVETQELAVPGRVTAVIALLGYVAVLAASFRLMLCWRRNVAVILLCVALAWFLISELLHGYQIVRSPRPQGGWTDVGFVALAGLCGVAALTRSMRDVAAPGSARHSLTPWRLALIAVGLLVAPAVLIAEAMRGPVETGVAIATAAALVSFLVLVRLSMSGRAYQSRAAREHAGRLASQAMVSATTRTDVVAGTRAALRPLRGRSGRIDVTLSDCNAVEGPYNAVVRRTDGRAEFAAPLAGSDAVLVFSGPARKLADLADLLRSLADQAAVAVQRIGLAEAFVAEERERYFRTLVLTSTDAILISRGGRIEYATPSAANIFGRDVVGEDFGNLVRRLDRPDDDPQWPDVVEGEEGVVKRPEGDVAVVIHRRDLTGEPTVRGIVTTLRDVTAERELQRDLAYRASHDELTGMVNARAWSETLSAEVDRRRGPGDGVAVVFIDIDDFKAINDQYGHPTGDRVLAEVARRIRQHLRAQDIAARVGGDEFAVLLRGLADIGDARVVAQRLADALSRPVSVDAFEIDCKASIGLSYTEGQERIESLVRQADTALYAAKEQGKGRWTEFNGTQWAPSRRAVRDGSVGESSR